MDGLEKNIWIVANWKSNKNIAEALDWVSAVGPKIPKNPPANRLKVVVCPTFSCLSEVTKEIKVNNYPITIGSQDLSVFGTGAYTGEESSELLKELVSLSILGHSERRKNFSETDEVIAKKVTQAQGNNITPLLCVADENTPVPQGVKLIAYEPIWAIGTGNADTPEGANEIAKKIKEKNGNDIEVLYGGSVNSSNVKSFTDESDISGVLVGSASLDEMEFIKILKVYER
jgi:triosephosphate isomerase